MTPRPISPIKTRTERTRSATLIRIPMIADGTGMALALKWTREYFTQSPASSLGWTPPPIPADVGSFIPCTLLITDEQDIITRRTTGRIRFLRDVQGYDTESTYFDQEWPLTPEA